MLSTNNSYRLLFFAHTLHTVALTSFIYCILLLYLYSISIHSSIPLFMSFMYFISADIYIRMYPRLRMDRVTAKIRATKRAVEMG